LGELTFRFLWISWKDAYDELRDFQYPDYGKAESSWKIISEEDVNILPFRGPAPKVKKDENTYRILALGDSYTWGDKIRDSKDIWTSVLERELEKHFRNRRKIEVINFGACAFTTVNEYELLEKYGWKFNPDLIILQYSLNDPLSSSRNFEHVHDRWFFRTKDLVNWQKPHSFLDQHSYFYSFLNHRFQRLQRKLFYKEGHNLLYQEDFSGWKDCQTALALIGKSAINREVKVIFVIFPIFISGKQTRTTYPYSSIHDKLSNLGRKQGFYVLDLLDEFINRNKDFQFWWALPLDVHPNEQAHEITADAIKALIINEKIIEE